MKNLYYMYNIYTQSQRTQSESLFSVKSNKDKLQYISDIAANYTTCIHMMLVLLYASLWWELMYKKTILLFATRVRTFHNWR